MRGGERKDEHSITCREEARESCGLDARAHRDLLAPRLAAVHEQKVGVVGLEAARAGRVDAPLDVVDLGNACAGEARVDDAREGGVTARAGWDERTLDGAPTVRLGCWFRRGSKLSWWVTQRWTATPIVGTFDDA